MSTMVPTIPPAGGVGVSCSARARRAIMPLMAGTPKDHDPYVQRSRGKIEWGGPFTRWSESPIMATGDRLTNGVTMKARTTVDEDGRRRESAALGVPSPRTVARILAPMPEDAELLRAWREGDRSAGEELFERYYPTVERFFRNKVVDADELIQRTFLACTEATTRFRGDSKFRTFLLGIATNVLRTHYRNLQREQGIESLHTTSMAAMGHTPSRVVAEQEQERLLLAALRRLPIELQLVLELRYWEELKHEELAVILDLPRSTVNTRLRRARELLERYFNELATSPQILHSTVTRLDDWVEQQRRRRAAPPGSGG